MSELIRTTLEADGVLVAVIDMPGRTMNVFSPELIEALDALMDRVDADAAVKSCVLTSAKPAFIAGADLAMVRGFCDAAATATPAQMTELCGRLGRQFVRLEASAKPWVAALNGLAMGGGLELALACRVRLVVDDARIALGVPEVKLGLLPGAGGTQRLPRLVGFERALDLLLSGRSIAPAQAAQWGLARAVPAASLLDEARAAARALHGQPYDAAAKYPHLAQDDVPPAAGSDAPAIAARHGIDAEQFAHYPAYHAIVDSVLLGAHLPLAEANAVEMQQFLLLMFNPVAGRMIRTLFLERLRAERELTPPAGVRPTGIRIGALSAARLAWQEALARARPAVEQAADVPADTLELTDAGGRTFTFGLHVLGETVPIAGRPALPALLLPPASAHGRVVEIVGGGEAATVAAALCASLRILPWTTPGPASALQRLSGLPLPAQQQLAREIQARADAGDPAFLDVAACLAGVSPAWSGGPLTWSA